MRKALGLTQVELAAALDVAGRSVKRYEAGTSTIPSDIILQMKALGIDPGYLFGVASTGSVSSELPPAVDEGVLREVVEWVDGEWAGSEPMDDFERLLWILREYLATVRQQPSSSIDVPAPKSRRPKAA